jgi:hypothetical protein
MRAISHQPVVTIQETQPSAGVRFLRGIAGNRGNIAEKVRDFLQYRAAGE